MRRSAAALRGRPGVAARRWTSSNKPLPGPTCQCLSASTMMAGRVPPTPGSTTQRNTVFAETRQHRPPTDRPIPSDRASAKRSDLWDARRHLVQHRLHLTSVRSVQLEIRDQHNHALSSPELAGAMQCFGRLPPYGPGACRGHIFESVCPDIHDTRVSSATRR